MEEDRQRNKHAKRLGVVVAKSDDFWDVDQECTEQLHQEAN